jgi:hypothetical protein
MRAAEMFERSRRQVDVMAELGVSAQTASRWHRDWLTGGKEALAGAGRAGRMSGLSDEQLVEVEAALAEGSKTHGFPTDLWTLARVGRGDRAGHRCAALDHPDLDDSAGAVGLEPAASGTACGRA